MNAIVSKIKLIRSIHIGVLSHILICAQRFFYVFQIQNMYLQVTVKNWIVIYSHLCVRLKMDVHCCVEIGPVASWQYFIASSLVFLSRSKTPEKRKLPVELFKHFSTITSFIQICMQRGGQWCYMNICGLTTHTNLMFINSNAPRTYWLKMELMILVNHLPSLINTFPASVPKHDFNRISTYKLNSGT